MLGKKSLQVFGGKTYQPMKGRVDIHYSRMTLLKKLIREYELQQKRLINVAQKYSKITLNSQ